jgi:hypothetical protein
MHAGLLAETQQQLDSEKALKLALEKEVDQLRRAQKQVCAKMSYCSLSVSLGQHEPGRPRGSPQPRERRGR